MQPLVEFLHRRLDVRITPGATPDGHHGAGFLDPGRHDAARAMVLEAAPQYFLVPGKQRRGQAIAGITPKLPIIPGEVEAFVTVDTAAAFEAPGAHDPSPVVPPASTAALPACAGLTDLISCVMVSRSTINHMRQPLT